MAKTCIYPSLLSADLLNLKHEIQAVINSGADGIHLDIMDNHYVPNLTFGPGFCHAIRQQFPVLTIDVHLMVEPVDELIIAFAKAGASRISFHPEASKHVDRSLACIRSHGILSGLALNPATSTDWLTWCHHQMDFVLVMTVNPGFGGQKMISAIVPKIQAIRKKYPDLSISVDGGVDNTNSQQLIQAGTNALIAGNAIFKQKDYSSAIQQLL